MLARANRIVRADDYRNTVRRGRKSATAHCVVYQRPSATAASSRFGFIVAKNVGNAVTRNTVRRRLKAVAYTLLADSALGDRPALGVASVEAEGFSRERTDVVIRALPGSDAVPWSTLLEEITKAISKGAKA